MKSNASLLNGCRVLVLEDEYYLADDLVSALEKAGANVVGPISTVEAARAVRTEDVDLAVLDMNLHGQFSHEIADRLVAEGTPVVIATGYSKGAIPERLRGLPQIEKPFDVQSVVTLIAGQIQALNA